MLRLLSIASVFSLLLLALTLILWVRSTNVNDSVAFQSQNNYWCLVSDHGRFVVALIPGHFMPDGWSLASGKSVLADVITGVVYGRPLPRAWHSYDIPCFTVAAATATPPLLWASTLLLKRRRPRPGVCPTCSYNLAGNTSGVCPECGTAILGI